MRIAVLTSSRADYSIYLPLLKKLKEDSYFDLSIIAFGTHLSRLHGYTVNNIINDGFEVAHEVESIVLGDSPAVIDSSIALTIQKFSFLWSTDSYDLVLALGDRYEMFAAVLSTLPFNLKVAHIHGGESTLGAIDNILRHSITLMSSLHFVSTKQYKDKAVSLLGTETNVYNVGALSIENMKDLILLNLNEFEIAFQVDLSKPTILCTFHPETVEYKKNISYVEELLSAFDKLSKFQFLITMPNIDTMSNHIREALIEFAKDRENIILKESLGTIGYLSAIKYCSFMLGNSSSGFVDASFFPKKVINIGHRQDGRIITPNIYNCEINKEEILRTVDLVSQSSDPDHIQVYGAGDTSNKIITYIKEYFNKDKQ